MKKQTKEYYLLIVHFDVEPELLGPYKSKLERDDEAREWKADHGDKDGLFPVEIPMGVKINIGTYSGGFFGDEYV